MLHAHANLVLHCPADAIFHHIAAEISENYPKWSPEARELEPLTPGPVGLGNQTRQVRVDQGRRSKPTLQIAAYQPGRHIAFVSTSSPYYQVSYQLEPTQEAARLHFAFELQLDFFLKPLKPVIAPVLWAESERVG